MDTALLILDLAIVIGIIALLVAISHQLQNLKEIIQMAFEDLKNAIEHSHTVQAAAVVLIKDLADKIAELARHPDAEEMQRLAVDLRQKADELAGAIALHEESGGEDEK